MVKRYNDLCLCKYQLEILRQWFDIANRETVLNDRQHKELDFDSAKGCRLAGERLESITSIPLHVFFRRFSKRRDRSSKSTSSDADVLLLAPGTDGKLVGTDGRLGMPVKDGLVGCCTSGATAPGLL